MWERYGKFCVHAQNINIDLFSDRNGDKPIKRAATLINSLILLSIIIVSILLSFQYSVAQETLNIPSYYGGTTTNNQGVQNSNQQLQQQPSVQNYQNLVNNIQINQGLISQLSESNEVVANPNTGEIRTVGTTDPTPTGWMRLDVTPTTNGYTIGNNAQGGQFSYSIQSGPTVTQVQPVNTINPNTFQVAQAQQQIPGSSFNSGIAPANNNSGGMTQVEAPPLVMNETAGYGLAPIPSTQSGGAPQTTFYTAPNSPGAQTTVTTDTQTTVGETTTQNLDNGGTSTATPTETVDTTVTTITTADSETVITETTTTTVTEGTITTPGTVTVGSPVVIEFPEIVASDSGAPGVPVPYPTDSAASLTGDGTKVVIDPNDPQVVTNQPDYADPGSVPTNGSTLTTFPDEVFTPVLEPTPNSDVPAPFPNINVASDLPNDGTSTAFEEYEDDAEIQNTETSDVAASEETEEEIDTSDEIDVVDAGTEAETEDGSTDETESDDTEGTQTAGTDAPSSQVANNNAATSTGPSPEERAAAAARAAEEERRRREEYIRMQQEASNLRQGSQNRASALLEENNTAMMGAASGQMGANSGGMMDPQRMSIFSQNARIAAGNANANLSPQIASLSNTVASANEGLGEVGAGAFAPCPPILANACEEAANRLADEIEDEIAEASDEAEDQVDKELDGVDEDLDKNGDRADGEQDRRDNRSDRQKAIDALEEEQKQRAEDLSEEGDELEERGNEQQERRERLEQEERDLRKQEQDARRNGDPNCRGPECRAIREQRQQNSRDTTDLAREEGEFQADQARFQGKVQDYQRRQADLDEKRQGDPRYETQRARNAAHQTAADAQSDVDRLKEEQLNLRRQGGSGSRQDRAYDRAIERAERNAQAASNNAELADRMALKAEFYANGMKDEWENYENARKASDAFNNFLDANNEAADLRDRTSSAQGALDAARQDPDFDPASLESLEDEVDSLRSQLGSAQDAVRKFSEDIGDTTESLTGNRMGATNETSRHLSQTLGDISHEFAERQRLSNLSDAELANEVDMIDEAKERVAAARNGLRGPMQDPGGQHTERFNALKAEQEQLQENIDNFNPMGSSGTGVVFGADEAYRNMQNRLSEVESELEGMNAIDVANSAFERVEAHNQWEAGLTDGLPTNADGTINRPVFARQVGEMAQAQVNLVNANGNLESAKNELERAQQNGDNATIERGQSRVNQYNEVVNRITDQFAENDISITTSPDGEYAISANTVGASATWAAAAEGLVKAQTDTENQQRQLASAAGTIPPANTPRQATPANDNAQVNTSGTTERLVEVASEPVTVSEPPLNPPGGFFQGVIDGANNLAKQAQRGAAMAAAATTKPQPSIADRHELVKNATQEARERRGEATGIENDIERAKLNAELAQKEAEFQRGQADNTSETRERQADEYVGFADYAEEQAGKNRSKAEDLEGQAERLRQSAARYNAIADSTDDRSLARDARAAADDNLENAGQRDDRAQDYRDEAGRADARARELTSRETEIRNDQSGAETRAENAEADAARAQAEVARLESEAARLNGEAAKLDQLAISHANELAQTQLDAFNKLMTNPPEGWRWSSLNSSERSTWLSENIPQWGDLNTDQRIEYLERLELGEAANDFTTQNAAYEEFNDSDQGKRSTSEMLESRARDLTNLQTRLNELNDMTFWNDEEEAEAKKLKEGIETGTFRLRADQRARAMQETDRYEAWQEQNRKLWSVNDEKRAEEVQRHVDHYSELQAQVGNARSIQAARSDAFDVRETQINNRINNPTSARDAEVAKGELSRLKEARSYWDEFDARTVTGSEAIAAEARREITYYGIMNGLGEIGSDEGLEERTSAKLMADSALNSRRLDTSTNIQTAIGGMDFTAPSQNGWEMIITQYDATADAIEDTSVAISAGAGALYGGVKGVVKGAYGIVDLLVIQPIDLDLEIMQLYFNEQTGLNVDIVGTETLDAINSIGESNFGELGMKFVIGEGKKISDGLNKLDSSFQTGSLTDAFIGTSEITAVGTELFVDPTLAIGIGGKVVSVFRVLDKVDDVAQVANALGDVALAVDTLGDTSRVGGIGVDATRVTDRIGDTARAVDSALAPEITGGAYRGLDEILGPDYARAFGEVPRAPVYPPARPAPLRPSAATAPSTPAPLRNGPFVGFDELMGPDFARALDDVPPAPLAPDGVPFQGFDELMGPEFANAFGTTPRAPVFPPARPSPLRPSAGTAPSTSLPSREGPFIGFDELMGPEFAGALDGPIPASTFTPDGLPYRGLDEFLGPDFANALGATPRPPVYPPVRPSPLRTGVGNAPSTPAPSRSGPFQGFDELMGSDFARALDDVPSVPRDPAGIPYQGLDEILGSDFARALGEVPRAPVYPPARPSPLRLGAGNTPAAPLPPRNEPFIGLDEMLGPEFRNAFDDPLPGSFRDGPGGTAPLRNGPGGTQPLGGGNGAQIPPSNVSGPPPASGSGIPGSRPSAAGPVPTPANSNLPLQPGQSGTPVDLANFGPNGTLPNGPGSFPSVRSSNLPNNGAVPDGPLAGAGDNMLVGPNGTDVAQLPPGVFRTADGLMQVPVAPVPVVTARQAGNFIVLEDVATGSRQLLEMGNEIGRGSFTVVNDLKGRNAGSVSKISQQVDPVTARLDNVGTTAFTDLPKAVKDNFVYTPEPRGEFRVAAANDNGALAGRNIRLAEKAPVQTYSQARGARTPMTNQEVNSISRAQDLVNEGGHIVLDLKSNNFGFEDLSNGLKRTVVHDAGGTVPSVGNTATERAINAKIVQRALMTPDPQLVSDFKQAMNAYDTYKTQWAQAKAAGDDAAALAASNNMSNAAGRAFDITSGHGKSVLRQYGHLIDEASLGVPLSEIGFNPVLGFNQDGVRAAAAAAAANDNFTGFTNAALGGF